HIVCLTLFPYTTLFRSPFDMILNQIIEEHRSGNRHGSCGVGIYETLLRTKENRYSIFFGELLFLTDEQIKKRLQLIRDEWMRVRSEEHTSELQSRFDLV